MKSLLQMSNAAHIRLIVLSVAIMGCAYVPRALARSGQDDGFCLAEKWDPYEVAIAHIQHYPELNSESEDKLKKDWKTQVEGIFVGVETGSGCHAFFAPSTADSDWESLVDRETRGQPTKIIEWRPNLAAAEKKVATAKMSDTVSTKNVAGKKATPPVAVSRLANNPGGKGINATKCLTVKKNQDGTRSLFNICSYDVEAAWCVTEPNARCKPNSTWTIHAGSGYPLVEDGQNIWFGACKGANSPMELKPSSMTCK